MHDYRKLQQYELLGHPKTDASHKVLPVETKATETTFDEPTFSITESLTSISVPLSHLKPIVSNCSKIDKPLTSNEQKQMSDGPRINICNENVVYVDSDDEISLPDTPGSSTSTPTPPAEYVAKLQEAEILIANLKKENRHQRREVI